MHLCSGHKTNILLLFAAPLPSNHRLIWSEKLRYSTLSYYHPLPLSRIYSRFLHRLKQMILSWKGHSLQEAAVSEHSSWTREPEFLQLIAVMNNLYLTWLWLVHPLNKQPSQRHISKLITTLVWMRPRTEAGLVKTFRRSAGCSSILDVTALTDRLCKAKNIWKIKIYEKLYLKKSQKFDLLTNYEMKSQINEMKMSKRWDKLTFWDKMWKIFHSHPKLHDIKYHNYDK